MNYLHHNHLLMHILITKCPSNFFSNIQLYCSCLSVGLLSYYGRLTLMRLIAEKGRVWLTRRQHSFLNCMICHTDLFFLYASTTCIKLSRLLPGHIFSATQSYLVESICYCTTANRLINECNKSGWLKKNWTGTRRNVRPSLQLVR